MALWPLYHFDDLVDCFNCRTKLDTAKAGNVIGFGDGNGNREQSCHGCGMKTYYDCTKSHQAAKSWWEKNADHLEIIRQKSFKSKRPANAFDIGSGTATPPKKAAQKKSGNSEPSYAGDKPTALQPKRPAGAFDLAGLINEETDK